VTEPIHVTHHRLFVRKTQIICEATFLLFYKIKNKKVFEDRQETFFKKFLDRGSGQSPAQ